MTTVVMFYAVVVSLLIVPAAMLADRAATLRRVPRRWIWTAALVATITLPALAPWRAVASGAAPASGADASGAPAGSMVSVTWTVVAAGVQDRVAAITATLLSVEPWAVVTWLAASGAVALLYGTAYVALLRRRRQWTRAVVGGSPVLMSGDTGPAVLGIVSPAIALPSWALELDDDSLDIVLQHEREHVRARDPWLVYLGALGTVVMPWHPAVWWLFRRLRLAVEFDCDARVLASGRGRPEDVAAYGELLLAVATRCRPDTRLAIPALIESASTLSRRIAAMCPASVRFVRTKIAAAGLGALLLAAAACNAPVPTGATDAASAVAGPTGPEPASVATPAVQPEPAPPAIVSAPAQSSAPEVVRPGPGIVNPVPMSRRQPPYTSDAMRRKVQGQVQLEAVVSAEGTVTDVRVIKSLDADLDREAVKAARAWTFRPALRDGKPVAIVVMLEMSFTIH